MAIDQQRVASLESGRAVRSEFGRAHVTPTLPLSLHSLRVLNLVVALPLSLTSVPLDGGRILTVLRPLLIDGVQQMALLRLRLLHHAHQLFIQIGERRSSLVQLVGAHIPAAAAKAAGAAAKQRRVIIESAAAT